MNRPRSQKHRGADRKRILARGEELFESATDAHRSGNLDLARQLYRRVLAAQPRHADACHLLGFAEFQSSQFATAIELLGRAVAIRPNNAEFHNNLALAYLAAGELELSARHAALARDLGHCDGHGYLHVGWEHFRHHRLAWAESAYRQALLVQPDFDEPHNYLGVLFADQERWDEAIACFRQALELHPRYVEAWNNLGNALRDQQRTAEAIPCYERALELDGRFAPAHNNLGIALAQEGQVEAAVECYQRALQWQPEFVEALNNLGNACRELGQTEAAIEFYRRALRLQPGSSEILCNLGAGLRQQGQIPESIGCFRRAIVLQPNSIKIHRHLAAALEDAGQMDAAAACCRHLSRLEPRQPLWRLCHASLCGTIFQDRAEMDDWTRTLVAGIASIQQADFDLELPRLAEIAPPFPFKWQFFHGNPRELKESYAGIFRKRLPSAPFGAWIDTWRGPASRPRIGFLVTDGHEGVFLKSLREVLERLSRQWELYVLCSRKGAGRLRPAIARDDVQLIPLPSRFDQAARAIADSRCDLLYYWEVGTDATNYFLPFLRLAPVQITSWGVQVTSGISSLDAYLSSALVEPSNAQDHYTEPLSLARTLLTYRHRTQFPTTVRRRDHLAAPTDAHWYVCAQQLGKFHVDFDPLLGSILRRDAKGIVVVTGDPFGHNAKQLRRRFAAVLPDVAHRIHFLPRLEQADYLSLLQHADVLLDPPHFGGVNSTYDCLSLGKPIVTLRSPYHRGRYTWGCYRKMDFADCVVANADQYVELAVRLGTDTEYCHDVSTRLKAASHALFEDAAAVTEHERLFVELLQVKAAKR